MMKIGCHVSIAGGVFNAPERANALGCEILQIFTRSPQGGPAPKLTPEIISNFKNLNTKYKILNTYIHTPYYINFASSNPRIKNGSASVIRDELERGSLIGAKYVMTHLGSAKDAGIKKGVEMVIEGIGKALNGYRGTTKLLLENSAGSGDVIGSNLADLAKILKALKPHKALAGICLDTQHAWASGYDWVNNFEGTIKRIDKEIGLKNIKLIHANDSKPAFNARKDRHDHIGKGTIGLKGFKNIITFVKKLDIDMLLETEHPEVTEDIKILKKLRGK